MLFCIHIHIHIQMQVSTYRIPDVFLSLSLSSLCLSLVLLLPLSALILLWIEDSLFHAVAAICCFEYTIKYKYTYHHGLITLQPHTSSPTHASATIYNLVVSTGAPVPQQHHVMCVSSRVGSSCLLGRCNVVCTECTHWKPVCTSLWITVETRDGWLKWRIYLIPEQLGKQVSGPWGDSPYPNWTVLVGQTPCVRMWQARDQWQTPHALSLNWCWFNFGMHLSSSQDAYCFEFLEGFTTIKFLWALEACNAWMVVSA